MNVTKQTAGFFGVTVLVTVLLAYVSPALAQLPPPAPVPATVVQDQESSTNRLVFKKRQRRTYESSVDIRAPDGEQQVPLKEERIVIQSTQDTSPDRSQTRNTDALAKRSAWSHRPPDSPKKDKNEDNENWLLKPDTPLTDVMSVLGAISGTDKDKKKESEWGWLADEVIARDPKSLLAGKKKPDDKNKNKDDKDPTGKTDEASGEQGGNETPSGNTFDRKKDRRSGLFADRGEDSRAQDERDNPFEIDGQRRTKDDDKAPRGYFSRDLIVKDQQETDRENEKAASDDPNRTARATAAEDSSNDRDQAQEKPAFPMIQSLLANRGAKSTTESTGAAKNEYSLKVPKPPSPTEDAVGKNWSALSPRADSTISASYDRDRPVLGTMDTSGRIGGLFSPAQDTAGRSAIHTAPTIAPSIAPAAAATRDTTGPAWPSATVPGGSLWSPGSATGSRLPGIGSERSTLPAANNSTMPSTPYARPGSSFSSGYPGGLPK